MSEENKKVEDTTVNENKEEKNMEEKTEKKEETKKESKKTGKVKAWFKKHKRELIAGGIGIAAGAGATYGISELGRRHMIKKNDPCVPTEPDNYSPLDPNI